MSNTARKPRPYFTLVSIDNVMGFISVEFGDYSKKTVMEEMELQKESALSGMQFLILKSVDTQDAIGFEVAKLQAKLGGKHSA
jgi:hypothetical protein